MSGHVSAPPSILHWRCIVNRTKKLNQVLDNCAQWKVLWRTLGHGAVFTLVLSLSSSLFFPQVFLSPFPPPAPWPVSVALFAESGRVLSVPFSLLGLLLLLLHPNVVAWVNTPPLPHLLLLFISFTDLPTNLHTFSPNYSNAQSSYCSTKASSGSLLKRHITKKCGKRHYVSAELILTS